MSQKSRRSCEIIPGRAKAFHPARRDKVVEGAKKTKQLFFASLCAMVPLCGMRLFVFSQLLCDVCDMLMPLEAQIESLHASAVASLRPQSSSLRDHQHPGGRDRARLYTPALVTPALLLCQGAFALDTRLGMWYVVGGRSYVGNEKQGLGTGGRRPALRRCLPASLAQFVLRLKKAYQPW